MPTNYTPEELLAQLVSYPTVSATSNLALISFVEDYLTSHGIGSARTYNDVGDKAALHARIGPDCAGGIVLSAHTDVVPVDGQVWSGDPFKLREAGGRLYGRGTADMKGFAATVLAHVPKIRPENLKVPIHLALSYDEEIGCLGAPAMIDHMLRDGPRPSAVIVGEPTNMKVVTGHKGIVVLKTRIRGYPVHSSQLDRGVSAISAAAQLIGWLDGQTAKNRAKSTPDCPYDPPYTTVHCGVIKGGSAHNITAEHCEFVTDIRYLPEERAADWEAAYRTFAAKSVLPAMRRISPDCAIDIEKAADVPGLTEETDGRAEQLARSLTGDNGHSVVVYATEGGQFQEKGLSTIVCGPGSIDQAHQADEFIERTELAKCTAFLDQLCERLYRTLM
ncbi:MAG: acetylornithine deacetylase [Roseibium sp.]|nr:acetylornithine deacetylase [Roseibium sp.]